MGLLFSSGHKVWSQKYENLDFLADQIYMSLKIDFSSAMIEGLEIDEFIASDSSWETASVEMRDKFISAFNRSTMAKPIYNGQQHGTPSIYGSGIHMIIKDKPENCYTLVIRPFDVSEKGSHIIGIYQIVDRSGNPVYKENFDVEKGKFGSVTNLMTDAFEALGDKIGDDIATNSFIRSTRILAEELSSAVANSIPVGVQFKLSNEAYKAIRLKTQEGKVEDSTYSMMVESFSEVFNEAIRKKYKGKYEGCMTPDIDSAKWQLVIVVQYFDDKYGYYTMKLLTDKGPEVFGQFNAVWLKSEHDDFLDISDAIAKEMSIVVKPKKK